MQAVLFVYNQKSEGWGKGAASDYHCTQLWPCPQAQDLVLMRFNLRARNSPRLLPTRAYYSPMQCVREAILAAQILPLVGTLHQTVAAATAIGLSH